MDTFNQKLKMDLETIMAFIKTQSNLNDIQDVFIKGPKHNCGFMWTPKEWWTVEQYAALKIINNKVFDLDWDSGGYGIMMRKIQKRIKDDLPVATLKSEDNLIDDGRACAKAYQQTCFGKAMDNNNKAALKVAANEGMTAAAKYMMEQGGGDYAKMRSMFG